jgi:hypothetical protein
MYNQIISILLTSILGIIPFGYDKIPFMNYSIKDNDQLSEESKIFYRFLQKEGKILGNKYQMSMSSIGGGGGGDQGFWLMDLGFQRENSLLTEEQARKLIVQVVNDFLTDVNKEVSLRPYMRDYPFTPKNVDITIFNSDIEIGDCFYPFISAINSNQGKVGYFTEEEGQIYGYKTKKYETWDEAIAIIQKEEKGK